MEDAERTSLLITVLFHPSCGHCGHFYVSVHVMRSSLRIPFPCWFVSRWAQPSLSSAPTHCHLPMCLWVQAFIPYLLQSVSVVLSSVHILIPPKFSRESDVFCVTLTLPSPAHQVHKGSEEGGGHRRDHGHTALRAEQDGPRGVEEGARDPQSRGQSEPEAGRGRV